MSGNAETVRVDELEVLKRAVLKRLVESGLIASEQIQLENEIAPSELPYCRITLSGSAEYSYDSQKLMSLLVIVNIDLFGKTGSGTRELSQLGAQIEALFGKYDRDSSKRAITMGEAEEASANVERFGRAVGRTESGGLYRWAEMLYVRVVLTAAAESGTNHG